MPFDFNAHKCTKCDGTGWQMDSVPMLFSFAAYGMAMQGPLGGGRWLVQRPCPICRPKASMRSCGLCGGSEGDPDGGLLKGMILGGCLDHSSPRILLAKTMKTCPRCRKKH